VSRTERHRAWGYAVGGWRSGHSTGSGLEVGGTRLRLMASAFVNTSARQVGAARRAEDRLVN